MERSFGASRPDEGEETGLAWRGDEHRLQIEAAKDAGLAVRGLELDMYTAGFKNGITVEDPLDGAIVARGRTVLNEQELHRSLRATMRYLGLSSEAIKVRVHDGEFELRVAKRVAEASRAVVDAGWTALQIWIGFGLLGLAARAMMPAVGAAIFWGVGLLLGAWQLRRGMASGRAMLSARLALALGMLAREEQLILPPTIEADPT